MEGVHGAAVVIAGASSGIGKATALAFAEEGARLVLAARREGALEQTAEECRQRGAEAVVVPTDITDHDAVVRLVRRAVDAYGGIDVWIANAGVGAVGRFDETPMAAHRRVIETDLLGHMHGAHAVLPVFRRQGQGTFIATVSVGAWTPTPYAASYAAAKAGLDAFLESVRAELVDERGIAVCGVYPSFVDTPGLAHGANYSGHALEGRSPFMHEPEEVARTMVDVARRPRRRAVIGLETRLARLGHAVAPGLMETALGHGFRLGMRRRPPAAARDGNLFEPMEDGRGVRGGFRVEPPDWAGPVVLAGVAVAAVAAYAGLSRRGRRDLGRGL